MTSHSIPKRQRTVQTDWAADGQTCGMGRREGTLLLRNIPASLPAAVSVVCYRVSDFVGGHLTGIMIADLPLEVVQFFCTLFCLCPFVILAYLYIQRAVLREFLCEYADMNLKSCIFSSGKAQKPPCFVQKFCTVSENFLLGGVLLHNLTEKNLPHQKKKAHCAVPPRGQQRNTLFRVQQGLYSIPSVMAGNPASRIWRLTS